MNTLASYIKAIHNQTSVVSVVSESHKAGGYIDEGIEVNEVEKTYHFDNGVVIKHKVEQDNLSSDQLCDECWISYDVMDFNQLTITPQRKIFYNRCQESFWLKMISFRE